MTTIVIAEDDEHQAELVRRYMAREGFEARVVSDGHAALESARSGAADLLVLDVMLPVLDGYAVCRRLRDEGQELPILMLTARASEDDLLTGFELGADDYLSKPYSPRELVARVRALVRRGDDGSGRTRVVVGDLVVDDARHEASVSGIAADLTPAEFRILVALAENAGIVLSRVQLLRQLHGSHEYLTERTIDTHVKNIRTKIEVDPRRPERLRTVYGVGYKLVAPGDAGTRAP